MPDIDASLSLCPAAFFMQASADNGRLHTLGAPPISHVDEGSYGIYDDMEINLMSFHFDQLTSLVPVARLKGLENAKALMHLPAQANVV